MSQSKDLEELARRFLDLWQKQLSAQVGDAEIADEVGRAFGLWIQSIMALGQTGSRLMGSDNDGPSTLWPQATSPAFEHGSSDLGEFGRRIEHLEKRLAALEKRDRRRRRSHKKTG